MKFFKLIEITEDDYCDATEDTTYERCVQSVMHEEDGIYIAVDENEGYIEIAMEDLYGVEDEQL